MYEYIKGTLIHIEPLKAIIDVNGIGYKLFIPVNDVNQVQINEEVTFHTSLVIKENAHFLFGFLSRDERDLFEGLIAVSGIGPKTALALIGHLGWEQFHIAVSNHDIRMINKVPGIGKKTAQRLIIDMKDKLKSLVKSSLSTSSPLSNQTVSDAINALIHLGYNPLRAKKAVEDVYQKNDKTDTASLISAALTKF